MNNKFSPVAPSRSALANQLRLAPELATLRNAVIPHGLAAWPHDAPHVEAPPLRDKRRWQEEEAPVL